MAKLFEADFTTGSADDLVTSTTPSVTGSPAFVTSDKGEMLDFDSGEYLTYLAGMAAVGSADFSVVLWIQTSDAGAAGIYDNFSASGNLGFLTYVNGGKIHTFVGDGTLRNLGAGITDVDDGEAHLVFLEFNRTTAIYTQYVDNVLDRTRTLGGYGSFSGGAEALEIARDRTYLYDGGIYKVIIQEGLGDREAEWTAFQAAPPATSSLCSFKKDPQSLVFERSEIQTSFKKETQSLVFKDDIIKLGG
ncbi:MAG: hypothetical protein KAU20_03490 [Nanoarchaeota archaeon]|nr:hypothetical protein [Nanoarchaeota archaeon]